MIRLSGEQMRDRLAKVLEESETDSEQADQEMAKKNG